MALASEQRGGLREVWEEEAGDYYRCSVSFISVGGETRQNQCVVISLRNVWLPIVAKQSFSLRVSTDLSARFRCSVG